MLVFLPMDLSDQGADDALLARLRAKPPDLVLWTEHDLRADFGYRGFGVDYAQRTAEWIRRTYVPVAPPVGPMTLLARSPVAEQ